MTKASSLHRLTVLITFALPGCLPEIPEDITLCETVTVSPLTAPLAVGDSTQLAAAFDQTAARTPPAPDAALRWSTSDSLIARVDSITGVVRGLTPGSVDIVVGLPGTQPALGAARVVVFAPLLDRIITVRFRITCSTPSCSVWSLAGPIGLWTLATDGSDMRLVRDSMHYPDHPRVSPDGRTILFDEWDTLYVADGAGLTVRPVPTGMPSSYLASWSPDGRWILFAAYEPTTAKRQVFKVRPDGTDLRQLTKELYGAGEAAWSPDGQTIVFVRDSMANSRQVGAALLMDTAGTVIRTLRGSITPFFGRMPEWSPDGTALVFVHQPFLTKLDIATGQYDTLAVFDTNRPASWSPTGSRIVVSGGEIVYLDPTQRYPNAPWTLLRDLGPDSMFNHSAFYTPSNTGGLLGRH